MARRSTRWAFAALAALAVGSAAPAADPAGPALSAEQALSLRCSAAFAILGNEQQRGVAAAKAYPDVGKRGREFFVLSGARLMDELDLSREQLQALLRTEAETLQAERAKAADPAVQMRRTLGPCFGLLEATLPVGGR